jgi:cell wall-associated NlpC family hydrolase
MTTESILKPLLEHRGGFSFFLLLFGLWLIGCGPASPRFVGKDNAKKETKKEKSSSVRFASKEIEEETKEDDKKVDLSNAQQRFASATISAVPEPVENEKVKPKVEPVSPPGGFERQKMMDAILGWMGTPYEMGGESKGGIDCSAFSREIFRTSGGMELPRTTEQQVKLGAPVSKEEIQFGDLVFFNTTGNNPSHVGIYIGDDMFAHASVSFGVTLSSMYSSYYKKRFTEARRVLQ